MNQGTSGQTQAQLTEQTQAAQQLMNYQKTELPALGYSLKAVKNSASSNEALAAGEGAESARVAAAKAIADSRARTLGAGIAPGSGAAVGRTAGILAGGAGATGEGASRGRDVARSGTATNEENLIGEGNKVLAQANKGLEAAGATSGEEQASHDQADAAEHAQVSGLSTAALMAFA